MVHDGWRPASPPPAGWPPAQTFLSNECLALNNQVSVAVLHRGFWSPIWESTQRSHLVQARMRHASARTTLDTYGHLWPDADESTRSAIGAVIAERMDSVAKSPADPLRTESCSSRRRRSSES